MWAPAMSVDKFVSRCQTGEFLNQRPALVLLPAQDSSPYTAD
jgi:hypothetical protein